MAKPLDPYRKLANFLCELNVLKRMPRTGSFVAGIKHPDDVAEHVFRATQLGFILAELEGVSDKNRVMRMVMVHDNAEARIGDVNKVMARYFKDKRKAELKAFEEQCSNLPETLAKEFLGLFREYEAQKTPESRVARDADLLELAFQAKEFMDIGYQAKTLWIKNVQENLTTPSAQKLFGAMMETKVNDWWEELNGDT
ncbi:HD domain-containing protein [Candidatus Peregrinibacteria bacterium]|nr:HD domain-containing protein [Candidatus Peregrinibacteria bacterium]